MSRKSDKESEDKETRQKKYPLAQAVGAATRALTAARHGTEEDDTGFDHPHSDHHDDDDPTPNPTLAVTFSPMEDDDSYYQPTDDDEVAISGYVMNRIAYYYVDNAQYTANYGRLFDPDAVRFLHEVAGIRPVRHEYTIHPNQIFETVPIHRQGLS